MKRHPIDKPPKRNGRYLVGTEQDTFFGNFYVRHFGPWILEGARCPSSPLTWWAQVPKPGLKPK